MLVDGVCIGALLAANRTPRPFPAQEVQLLGSFANEQLRERSAAASALTIVAVLFARETRGESLAHDRSLTRERQPSPGLG